MSVVNKIKTLCEMRDMSIFALEREIGLGRGTIRNWDKNSPSSDKILKVADYFNVSLDSLIGNEDRYYYGQLKDYDNRIEFFEKYYEKVTTHLQTLKEYKKLLEPMAAPEINHIPHKGNNITSERIEEVDRLALYKADKARLDKEFSWVSGLQSNVMGFLTRLKNDRDAIEHTRNLDSEIRGIVRLKEEFNADIILSETEQTLIVKYRALDERGKETVNAILNAQYLCFLPKKSTENEVS